MGHPFNVALQNKIRRKLNAGAIKQASILGMPFDIVRNETVLVVDEPYVHYQWSRRKDQEALTEPFFYKFIGSRVDLRVGDHLVGKRAETPYGQSTLLERYTVVSLRDFGPTMTIRTDWLCKAFRPTQINPTGEITPGVGFDPNQFNPQQFDSGDPDSYNWRTALVDPQLFRNKSTGMWEFRLPNDTDLNDYSPNFWVGITSGYSADYKIKAETPLTVRPNEFVITLGNLPGIIFQEGDMIVDSRNIWYRVDMPHYQKDSSFIQQLYTSRVIA